MKQGRLSGVSLRLAFAAFGVLAFVFTSASVPGVSAATDIDNSAVPERIQHPALGISQTFGRWTDTVHLRYNPAGAHPDFADNEYMLELLREAAGRWEAVSGIKFDIALAGQSSVQGEVPVFWESDPNENWAGKAAPGFDSYDVNRGYYPYQGGTVKFNRAVTTTSLAMLRTMTHELGHLLGLGHSDNPLSIMYANPYNNYQYPLMDDIRAVQVLYGPPAKNIDLIFPPYPSASSQRRQSIFHLGEDPVSLVSGASGVSGSEMILITKIDEKTPDDRSLYLRVKILHGKPAIAARLKIVTPDGMMIQNMPIQLECSTGNLAASYCIFNYPVSRVAALKVMPGTWRMYLTDDETLTENPEVLAEVGLDVDAYSTVNLAPEARVYIKSGTSQNSIQVQVQADDPEGDNVEVRWQIPGPLVDLDGDGYLDTSINEKIGRKTVTDWRTIYLPSSGGYEFFIEVKDDFVRYGDGEIDGSRSGPGFQTLLRVVVSLPYKSEADVSVYSSRVPRVGSRWLSTLNGVRPHPQYKLPYQLIGVISDPLDRIHSCVQVLRDGKPDPGFDPNMDVTFDLVSLERGEIRLLASRKSSPVPGNDGSQERCSGRFEQTTGMYRDIIRLGDQVFDAEFMLTNDAELTFQLVGGDELRP